MKNERSGDLDKWMAKDWLGVRKVGEENWAEDYEREDYMN